MYMSRHMGRARTIFCLVLLAAGVPGRHAAAGPPMSPSVPHLNGIFLSINGAQANWTQPQWEKDLRAMKAVGIEFFCPRAAADGDGSGPTDACPFGGFTSFFPSRNPCFHASPGMPEGGALATLLAAAKAVGLKVHLGLAWPSHVALHAVDKRINGSYSLYYRELAWLEWDTAVELWSLYGEKHRQDIAGIYTMVEESNSVGWFSQTTDLTGHYLEPLARDIKQNLSSELLVWASPYYVGNLTRHKPTDIMDAQFYGDWWAQVLEWCPHLDLIAPQDSMGAQGNSFRNVTDFLGAMARGSRRVGRSIWSNVERFEVWPLPEGKGRHPAPIERIKQQIANEVGLADKLIAWEWHSCLSPNAADIAYGDVIKQRYLDYLAYVTGK